MKTTKRLMFHRALRPLMFCGWMALMVTAIWQPGDAKAASAEKPNVMIILTDDQGYGDVGCYGSTTIKTPNLDRLASEGVRFTDGYSANSVCSPARAGLLTGRYPTRTTIANVVLPELPDGMPSSEITLAEILKQAGYATACIGKWHLGHLPEFLPTRQGFDSYFGIPYSNDMSIDPQAPLAKDIQLNRGVTVEGIRADRYNRSITNAGGDASSPAERYYVPLMRGEEVVEFPVEQATLTQRYTDEAIGFIKQHAKHPFFLYLPYAAPHVPLAVTDAFRGKSKAGLYGDAVEELDWNIGRLLAVLAELKLDKNTLVIFTSDNGPWLGLGECSGTAGPLKGGKFRTDEGGQRVPMIARWVGRIPAGQVCKTVVSALDLFPTVAGLAGQALPQDRVIDGRNIWPLLSGQGSAVQETDFFYLRGWEVQAVRRGPWKVQEALGGHAYRAQKIPGNPGHLYNLESDIRESTNVASEHPDRFAQLKKRIAEMDSAIGSGAKTK
jgi:arylsulfatase A-like enzyme